MDSLEQLRQRKTRVQPGFEVSGMAFEGVLKTLAHELGETRASELRRDPFMPKRVIGLFKYPMSTYMELADLGAELLRAQGWTFTRALQAFGTASVEAFFESPVGRLMLAMNGGNAQRLLGAAAVAYKTIYSFGERTYEPLGPKEGVFHYRIELAGPALQSGVLMAGLRDSMGLTPALAYEGANADGSEFSLRLSW